MANGGRIDFTVGYKLDKTGLNDIKKELNELSKLSATQIKLDNPTLNMNQAMSAMQKIRRSIDEIQPALDKAFDTTTGVVNLQKLNTSLKTLDLKRIQSDFAAIGPKGQQAFLNITKSILTTNVALKQTNGFLDKMGTTFINTIKWGFSSSLINSFTGAVQQAYGYVQHLDTSLNDIRIVTGKSADEMDRFAEKANKAAKELGQSTTAYTEASLIYYQQGLSDEEAQARAETTLKAANVTGQSGREVSEQLTAVWNGYKVTAEETEMYVDKLAAVAASTASDLEELSIGMSKVASAANNMGVDIDQLNAQLATIISVTRQAPETAGTALKTIYARMEDLKISGEDEDGVKLGEVSSTLEAVGISVMDTSGDLRDLGEVIEEVASKWDGWTQAQQDAIAQALAGKRQYNNLLALFENWDMYTEALETSRNSLGTLQQQQDIHMESTEAHIQQLKTQWEDFYDSILDNNTINSVTDSLTKVLSVITDIIDSIGGGKTLITGLIALITTKFSKQIAQAFSPLITNIQNAQNNAKILENLLNNINAQKMTGAIGGNAAQVMTETQQEMSKYWDIMSQEEFNASQAIIQEIGEWENKKEAIAATNAELQQYIENSNANKKIKSIFQSEDVGFFGSSSNLQATKYLEETLLPDIELIQNRFTTLNTHVQGFSEHLIELRRTGKALSDTDNPFQNMDIALNNAIRDVEILQGLNEHGLLGKNGDAIVEKAVNTLEKLQIKMEEVKAEVGKVPTTTFAKKINEDLNDVSNSLDPVNAKIQQYSNNLRTGTAVTREAETEEEVLRDKLEIGNLSIQKRTQAISQLVGSLSSFVFGMQSLMNIGRILSDDDIDGFEAVKQIITSLIISLPMLTSGLSRVKDSLAILTVEENIFTTSLEAQNAGLMGNIVALAMHKLGLEYDTKASAKNNLITLLNVAGEKLSTTAIGENTSALWANVAAWLGLDAAAAPVVAVLAAIALAVAAVTAAIIVCVSMYKDQIESLQRDADAQQALSKELRVTTEEMQTQKEAADELVNKYDELKTSAGDFRTQLHELLIEYGYLTEANLALTDSYEHLDEMMKKIQIDANQDVINAADTQIEQDKATVASQLWAKGKDEHETAFDINSGQRAIDLGTIEDTNEVKDILDKYGIEILKDGHISLQDFSNAIVEDYDELFADLSQSTSESAQVLLDYINNYLDNDLISGTKEAQTSKRNAKEKNVQLETDWASKITDSNSYDEAIKDYATQLVGENATEEEFEEATKKAQKYFNTISDLAVQLNSFQKQLETTDYTIVQSANSIFNEEDIDKFEKVQEKMKKAIEENYDGDSEAFFKDLEQGFAVGFDTLDEEFQDGAKLIENYSDQYKDIFGEELNWENLLSLSPEDVSEANTVTQEQFDNLTQLISQYDPTGKISAWLTPDDWNKMLGLAKEGDVEALSTVIQDSLTKAYDNALIGFQDSAGNMENNLQTVIEQSISGNVETDEDSVYASMLADMETLKEFYPELTAEVDIFNNKALIGTEQWTQACYSLQEALSNIELTKLTKEADDLFNAFKETELHFDINSEEYENALSELLDKNYEIDIEIHADAEDAFDNFTSSLNSMDDMVDKIDEGFTVSAEDIRELNNTFPGILQGMEVLSDGTVQLNEEIAQSAIDSAQAEEDANFKTLISQLENQKTLLKAKQEQYQIIADAYNDLAENEDLTDEARAKVDAALNELQQLNNQTTTDYELDNNELIASDSNVNAEITAANWTQAWQEVSNSSYIAAQDAIKNQQAIKDNNSSLLQKSSFGSNYQGKNGSSSEAQQTSELKQTLDSDAANAAKAAAAQAMADAAGKAANDIDGMIAEATAKYRNTSFSNSSAGSFKSDNSSGSGSSSEKDADHEEYLEREEDIYKQINEELDQIEATLGRIQTVSDHKWGLDAQKALEKENELLDKQLEKLEEKKQLQYGDIAHQRGVLESIGVAFSDDGSTMLNSEDVLDALYANYNSMVAAYNSMSAAEQEVYKAELENEKARIEDIEGKIDAYESSFSDYQDTLDKLLDAHYAQIENEVKLFNNMVDVHLELNDARKEWDKFWSEVVEDVQDNDFAGQIAASMKQLKTLVGLGGDVKESDVYTLTQHLMDTTTQVNAQIASANRGGEDSIFGDDTALSKENLQNYIQQLMDAVTAAKEALDNMAENYLKILDDAQDKIDKQIEGWESINDHLEHNLELIKLISGEKAFDAIDNQLEKQYENNLNLLTTQKASQDFWAGEVKRYETLMASVDKNSKQYQTYEEAYNKSVENYRKAVSDLDKTVETSIKNLQDWRKNAVDNVMDTLDKAMSKGMGLDNMEKQWKLINDYASKYLDNVERALGMEEYTNVLDEAVNATGLTAANQEKLNQFREVELAQLNQKNKLTQFDLDESKARLEILKQQMALEDARNNKSNMRLRRDSQGNYTYQYTGDQEAEDQAENGLLTARREWYELVKARNKETRDDILAMEQQYQDNLKAMDEARLNNDIATLNALEEANKTLLEEIQFGYEQAEIAKRDLFQGTAQFFTDVEDAEILPMWEATIDEMVDEWSGGGEDSFIGACTKAIQDLESVQDKYVDRTHQVLNTAGIDYNKLKEKGIDPTDESLQQLVMDNEEFATILEEVNDLLDEQEGYLRDAEAAYNDLETAAVSALTSAQATMEELSRTSIQAVQDIQAAISAASAAYNFNPGVGSTSSAGSSGGGGGAGDGSKDDPSTKPVLTVYRKYGTANLYYTTIGMREFETTVKSDGAKAAQDLSSQVGNGYTVQDPYTKRKFYMGTEIYKSGGYTGDWSQGIPGTDNGRLAVLHQKELVLNADDTSNMLKAVEVVRQLFSSNIISGIAQSLLSIGNGGLLGGISSGVQSMGSHISNSVASNNSNITINADFSGVHDADEIYEAFTQLQNTALQSNFSTAPHLNISY